MERAVFLAPVRVGKRVFIFLTFALVVYIFYLINTRPWRLPPVKETPLSQQEGLPVVDPLQIKPDESLDTILKGRSIFSTTDNLIWDQEAPSGQLPGNYKITGIVIAHPVEVVIEDTSRKESYFISEGRPAGGFSIGFIEKDRIILNYQGQSFSLPVNTKPFNEPLH